MGAEQPPPPNDSPRGSIELRKSGRGAPALQDVAQGYARLVDSRSVEYGERKDVKLHASGVSKPKCDDPVTRGLEDARAIGDDSKASKSFLALMNTSSALLEVGGDRGEARCPPCKTCTRGRSSLARTQILTGSLLVTPQFANRRVYVLVLTTQRVWKPEKRSSCHLSATHKSSYPQRGDRKSVV